MKFKINKKKTIVGITFGCFDFCHAGHCLHFEECKKYCDYLIVGLQTAHPKKNKPVMSLEERYLMLRANKFIDAILIYTDEEELHKLDLWLPIDVRFMGGDHLGEKHHPIKANVIFTSRNHSYSSSELRKRTYEYFIQSQEDR